MIAGKKKYSIPPGGMVLKGKLQLGNMWQSDHLSRKRTPRDEGRELRGGTTTSRLASSRLASRPPPPLGLLSVPEDEPLCVTSSTPKGVHPLGCRGALQRAMIDGEPLVLRRYLASS